jgi:hypothetical protein
LALSVLVLIGLLLTTRQKPPPSKPQAEPARTAPSAPAVACADAEIVSFLAMLQEKGRLVDFLMDNINAYNDAQVGAAAREKFDFPAARAAAYFGKKWRKEASAPRPNRAFSAGGGLGKLSCDCRAIASPTLKLCRCREEPIGRASWRQYVGWFAPVASPTRAVRAPLLND